MSKEDSADNIGKLTIQLDNLYKSDPTLDYLKRLEEDRKALLEVSNLTSAWGTPSVQEQLEDMRKALGYPELQDAFKSYEDYTAVTSPLISALTEDNPQPLLEAFKIDTEPYLNPIYAQTLKATDLFSETLANVSQLGLPEVPDYTEDMKKALSSYEDNFALGNKRLVELATSFENDAFKSSLALGDSIAKLTERMNPTLTALDSISSINSQAAKAISGITPKMPWLDSIYKHQDRMKALTEPIAKIQRSFELPKIKEHVHEVPHFELPKPEDSPHYKQNEKILQNSKEQIILLNKMSVYMSSQSEKLEFLNDITVKQVEENKVAADKSMASNAKSSRSAVWIAISSIFVSIIFALGSIALTYYVFIQENISDNKDHAEVVQLLKNNNINGSISELVEQLKVQNQSKIELERVRKENVKMKQQLEAQKSK